MDHVDLSGGLADPAGAAQAKGATRRDVQPRPLGHRQHGVGFGAGRRHAAGREGYLGAGIIIGGHVLDHRGLGLGGDGGAKAFLVIALHVVAKRDQHLAYGLHERLGSAAEHLAVQIVGGHQAQHQAVQPPLIAVPDAEGFGLFHGQAQLQAGHAGHVMFQLIAEDDVGRALRGMDKHDVGVLRAVPGPCGHGHHRRDARPGRDEQVLRRRMTVEAEDAVGAESPIRIPGLR